MERNAKLVSRKFIHYLIPSILMIFAMQFSSLLDGILIGNMISGNALAATSLVSPVLYIIQAPGFAVGLGGSIVIANRLGKRDIEGAKKAFSMSMIIGVGLSIVFAALSFFIAGPIARLFGEASLEYSEPFLMMYLLTDPIITIALLLGSFMAVDNNPKLSSIFFIISNFAKIGLEVLFIKIFPAGKEMYGAAISTGAGFLLSFSVLPFYFKSKKRMLRFSFKIKGEKIWNILKASSTLGINMVLTAIQMFIVNIYVGKLITAPIDLIAFGLIANVVFAFDLFCGGILNVIPNICGLFYGEKDYYSLKAVTRKIFWLTFGVTAIITAVIAIFPNAYCAIFGTTGLDQKTMDYVSLLIRVYLISFLPYEINKFNMNYYPSIEKNLPSLITVFLRELVIVLPLTLVLLFTHGLMGYNIACAVTESATVLITYGFVLIYNKKKETHSIFMFERGDVESFDVSIDNDIKNASLISEQLTGFAKEHGVNERESQIVGLAAEEIVNNIITYGYKHNHKNYIDVSLKKVNKTIVLRIRDDGMPFDPTKYEFDNDEKYSTSGIQLISKLTDKMTYMRVLSLNNTIFEINTGRTH